MVCRIMFLLVVVLQAVPAHALNMVFTDRTAFDAAVGGYTLLDLNTPDPIPLNELTAQISTGFYTVTYSDLFAITYDSSAWRPANPSGAPGPLAAFGAGGGFLTVGRILEPVTAFGFDIPYIGSTVTPTHPTPSPTFIVINGTAYQLDGLSFLGFMWDAPTTVKIDNSAPTDGKSFGLDNLAIKTVPEPSSLLLLAAGLLGLLALNSRRVRSASH